MYITRPPSPPCRSPLTRSWVTWLMAPCAPRKTTWFDGRQRRKKTPARREDWGRRNQETCGKQEKCGFNQEKHWFFSTKHGDFTKNHVYLTKKKDHNTNKHEDVTYNKADLINKNLVLTNEKEDLAYKPLFCKVNKHLYSTENMKIRPTKIRTESAHIWMKPTNNRD